MASGVAEAPPRSRLEPHRSYRRAVSPRLKIVLVVGSVALAAAAATVAYGLVSRGSSAPAESAAPACKTPPLALDLGLRQDAEARALERAQRLYSGSKPRQAAAIFDRYDSLQAQIGSLIAHWPVGTLKGLEQLAQAHPASASVLLHLGFARYCSGDGAGATAAWRQLVRRAPDAPEVVEAEDLLYPGFARGVPLFVPSFRPPKALLGVAAPRQLALLRRGAAAGDVHMLLLYGRALQQLGHAVSAEAAYRRAARLAPHDVDARVAAAVGRFDKADPTRAFSQLGPLTASFPHAASVRFHLGLLLLWTGQVAKGRTQLRLAVKLEPRSLIGRTASTYLDKLRSA
jgi:cytochrome c-type biogenesis protein CcmH/NrfG